MGLQISNRVLRDVVSTSKLQQQKAGDPGNHIGHCSDICLPGWGVGLRE